jgi:hypothetical protein
MCSCKGWCPLPLGILQPTRAIQDLAYPALSNGQILGTNKFFGRELALRSLTHEVSLGSFGELSPHSLGLLIVIAHWFLQKTSNDRLRVLELPGNLAVIQSRPVQLDDAPLLLRAQIFAFWHD